MAQHFEGDTKKFTLTAFLSFAIVFCVLILFMQCHGDYTFSASHHNTSGGAEHTTGTHGTDSTKHSKDSTMHGTDSTKEKHGGGENH